MLIEYIRFNTCNASVFLFIDSINFGVSGKKLSPTKLNPFKKLLNSKYKRHGVILIPNTNQCHCIGIMKYAKIGKNTKQAGINIATNADALVRVRLL